MTDQKIEEMAQWIYSSKALAEKKLHGQTIAPWSELGETFKESLRQMARDQLSKTTEDGEVQVSRASHYSA